MTSELPEVPDSDTEEKRAARRDRLREKLVYDLDLELGVVLDLIFGLDDEKTDSRVGLTLVTAAGVIEGMAISHRSYTDAQIKSVETKSEFLGQTLRLVDEGMAKLREQHKETRKDEPRGQRRYIHFSEANVVSGGNAKPVWNLRVDLTTVIGWSLIASTPNE